MLPEVDAPTISGVVSPDCVKLTVASEPAVEVEWRRLEVRLNGVPGEEAIVVKLVPGVEAPPPSPNVVVVVLRIASVSRICDVHEDVDMVTTGVATTGVAVVEHWHGSSMVV